jgi:hypothetical protein
MSVEPSAQHKFLAGSAMTFQEIFDFACKRFIPILQDLAVELGEDHFLEALKKVPFESTLKAGQEMACRLPATTSRLQCLDARTLSFRETHPDLRDRRRHTPSR